MAPYVQPPFYLLEPTDLLVYAPSVSAWNGACDDILWTQVPSEERTPSRLGLTFLLANWAEGAPSFSSHRIPFPL